MHSQESEGDDKWKDYNKLKIINESLKTCTLMVREKMFLTHDQLKVKIFNSLKRIEGVLLFEDIRRDQIVFSLPLSPLVTRIMYISKGYSFKEFFA